MLIVLKVAALAAVTVTFSLFDSATAQTRCEPTMTQPCNQTPAKQQLPASKALPATTSTNTLSNTLREPVAPPREKTKLDPVPVLPDIKLDKDTSMGFGHGGIIGLERKF